MTAEQQTREYCPAVGEMVTITRLLSAEGGGSCQVDISVLSVSCERSSRCPACRTHQDCLLDESGLYQA